MNTAQSLIIVNYSTLEASATDVAQAEIDAALTRAAHIGKVTNAEENTAAVEAQKGMASLRLLIIKAGKDAREPAVKMQKAVIALEKKLLAELDAEEARVARLLADFQALELKRQVAERNKVNAELDELERRKAEETAKATNLEQLDEIAERFDTERRLAQQYITPSSRAEGQTVREDWAIEVNNPYKLAQYHPECCKIEPRLSEIKVLLNRGVNVAGVTARKVVKSGVRAKAEPKAIAI